MGLQPRAVKRHKLRSNGLFIFFSLFMLALFALPIVAVFIRAFDGSFLAGAFSKQALAALQLSLTTSVISTACAIIFGTPLAYLLARWKSRFKIAIETLVDLPIALPPSVAGLALLIAFGRRGLFGAALTDMGISLPFTTAAVVLAQTFVSASLYIRAARIGFAGVDEQLEEAANVEGANQWQIFYSVMLPLSRRALFSGAILAWTRALGEFGATILFAGNLEGVTQTMPLAIYLGFERNIGAALSLSVILIFASALLLNLARHFEKDD